MPRQQCARIQRRNIRPAHLTGPVRPPLRNVPLVRPSGSIRLRWAEVFHRPRAAASRLPLVEVFPAVAERSSAVVAVFRAARVPPAGAAWAFAAKVYLEPGRQPP